MYPNVHSSNGHCCHSCQTVEGAKMPFNRRMDKEDMVHIYNAILHLHKKERIPNVCISMEGREEIMLSEISQAEKFNYHMVSLTYGAYGITWRKWGDGKEK